MYRTAIIAVLTVVLMFAPDATAQSRPPVPFFDRGACPFECCTYRQWSVDKPTVMRSAMSDSKATRRPVRTR